MPVNDTNGLAGRFCNHLIRNLYVSFLAEQNDLAISYSYLSEIQRLGIKLFTTGTKTYSQTVIIRDNDFLEYLDQPVQVNIFVDWLAAQNHPFAMRLYNYFRTPIVQASIIDANTFKNRIGKNNDVFVHVRLDDVAHYSPGFDYYDKAIEQCGAKSGFISSDSPDHPFVTGLAAKYGLELVQRDEVETIMLGSTCKHLVLSYGTFSWTIGALAFDANVYIPPTQFSGWVGDIFRMPGWKIVEPL
jgi:hypothetical protein